MNVTNLAGTLVVILSLASCVHAPLNKDIAEANVLFEYLDKELGKSFGIFLRGERLNFLVIRDGEQWINIYPTLREKALSPDEEATIQFAVSRKTVEKRKARCGASGGYVLRCDAAEEGEYIAADKVFDLLGILKRTKKSREILKPLGQAI
ncbi:hypothetical protein A3H04_04460 [Candidatus Giovannonibacteria bacterium RIFCSPLOWO2_12_FULL_43_11c]|nr:MAG: hypothetical protein A3H04_04460 [Candidatus Giovannonibacteria bacterium RIFCSPLOWO2_12_FULL_43_11c]